MANFDKIAPVFDNYSIQFSYWFAHRQCFSFVKECLQNNFSVLEIGCGTGNFLKRLKKAKKELKLFGLDESEKMIEIAQRKFKEMEFCQAKAEKLPFADNYFDFITIVDAFYYFKDKRKVISECARVLKPGGCLFIYMPSIDQFISKLLTGMTKIFSLEKESKHLSLKDLKQMAEEKGFSLVKEKNSSWPFMPFLRYWSVVFRKS